MVPGLKMYYEEWLERLGLWTLEERRNLADLLEMFKMYKGLSLTSFSQFFTTYIHIGLLCSWQNATNYTIIQIHALKIAKICKKKMLIHVFKQKSLEEVSRIAPNCQREFVTLRSKTVRMVTAIR